MTNTSDYAARCEATERLFLVAVREAGHWMSGDQRVTEETAAELLGIAPATLANKRHAGTAPVYYNTGRITYRLSDLAEHIEGTRNECAW